MTTTVRAIIEVFNQVSCTHSLETTLWTKRIIIMKVVVDSHDESVFVLMKKKHKKNKNNLLVSVWLSPFTLGVESPSGTSRVARYKTTRRSQIKKTINFTHPFSIDLPNMHQEDTVSCDLVGQRHFHHWRISVETQEWAYVWMVSIWHTGKSHILSTRCVRNRLIVASLSTSCNNVVASLSSCNKINTHNVFPSCWIGPVVQSWVSANLG
jgi:hypothetical protein